MTELTSQIIAEVASVLTDDMLTQDWNSIYKHAVKKGDVHVLKVLVPLMPPMNLTRAIDAGNVEIVKLLLADSRIDVSSCNNYDIRHAAYIGHAEIVKLLLADSRVDPINGNALVCAAEAGHIDVVKLLIPHTKFTKKALDVAVKWEHYKIAKLLLDMEI